MKNNDFKDFDISNFIELTEDQLRFEVNGGSKKSSSSSSSSSSRSNSSSSRGSSSSNSRGSSSTSTSKQSSSSTSTATGSSGSGRSNTSQSSGSREVANTNHAVANAKPGDTITRNNGTKITLTQGDINYAKAHENTPAVTITPSNPKLIAIKTNENSCTHSSSNSSGSTASGQKREAGYVMDNNAVGVAGHAGMYVENDDNSYDFFEVAPFTELHKQGEVVEEVIKNESNTPPKKIKKKILSCNSIGPLESKLTKLIGNESISGVNQYHFDNKQDMLEYLSKPVNMVDMIAITPAIKSRQDLICVI